MKIDRTTLPSMVADFGRFEGAVSEHAKETISESALLNPLIARARLRDAHYAWTEDLARVEKHEKKLVDGLDHFKHVAHLAYWLRRMSPIYGFEDRTHGMETEEDLYPEERSMREFLSKFGSEFLAFDLGFRICSFYEIKRPNSARQSPPVLSEELIGDVCHMMKFKHVSPHSLYLVYRSIMNA